VIVEDITDRERLERELRQSQRLESLGQLAGGVAHDFNNLLAVILNFAMFASSKIKKSVGSGEPNDLEAAVTDLDRVVRAAESATRLTRQLLAFARREVVRPRPLDVNSVVQELEPLLRRTTGEHIEFVSSLQEDPWSAVIDPGRLEQILTNLTVNARDAMPSGGRLIIETSNVEVDEVYASGRSGLKPGSYVAIRVSDTGSGMDANTLSHVFEPFFTTKPKGRGTGLGLATVHGIVNQAGGHISIYSEPGIGTRVHVLLPAIRESPPEERPAVATPITAGHATILVVEDAEDLRQICDQILTRNGYHVIAAGGGDEALAAAALYTDPIDLLLTDVVMPGIQGPELVTRLRTSHPETRVLFMSGYAEPMLGPSGALGTGLDLLDKPFTEPILIDRVQQALAKRDESAGEAATGPYIE
jgi:hypothetical protein